MATQNVPNDNENTITKILHKNDITQLNQLQYDTINAGLLEDQNFVIALPTGSGKTLLTIIKSEQITNWGQNIIYITPTRTLNEQIFQTYSNNFPLTKLIQGNMLLSQVKAALDNFQVLVSTLEKFYIELIDKPSLLDNIGLIIIDEIHLISDRKRGPTFEFIISLLLYLQEADEWNGHIIGLSGTLHNPEMIANWMNAAYIHSKIRLNPFEPYIIDFDLDTDELLCYSESEENIEFKVTRHSISNLDDTSSHNYNSLQSILIKVPEKFIRIILSCLYLIKQKKRVLILCSTRRETMYLNRTLIELVDELNFNKITSFYHHAGASKDHKKLVELLCSQGAFDCVFTTTTFAMGVDYPFDAVILPFLTLYDTLYDWKNIEIGQEKEIVVSHIFMLQQIIGRVGHQEETSAVVYCLGENYADGLKIYTHAIFNPPGIQSNFDTFFGKMKFQEFLNAGLTTGWFTNLQSLIDFSRQTFYSSALTYIATDQDNQQLINTKENILFDEIKDFIMNPLISLKYHNFILEDKIINFGELIEDLNFEELLIHGKSNLNLLSQKNVSPKQIIAFLRDFEKLYNDNKICLDTLKGINGIVKLIVKTSPSLFIEMGKLQPKMTTGKYKDKTLQKISKILSPIKKIDIYLSEDNSQMKFSEIELNVLRRIRNLIQVFKEVISLEFLDCKMFSDKMVNALPILKMHITNSLKKIESLIPK
ncbi:MAG: putative ski2-type helicase [Candidatus Heimdallarchaeota archaeon LC_2]|nr:MAG: putative ski2-type helicase [Candidatus Heimdallarchaeota archaeon LC_2]